MHRCKYGGMSLPLQGSGTASCNSTYTPDWKKIDNKALLSKYKDGANQAELDRYAYTAFKKMGAEAYLAANRAGSSGLDETGAKQPVAKISPDVKNFIDAQLYSVDQYRKNPSLRTSGTRVAGIVVNI